MPQLSTPMIHEVLNDVVACLDRKVKIPEPGCVDNLTWVKITGWFDCLLGWKQLTDLDDNLGRYN